MIAERNYYKNEGKKPKEIIGISFLSQCLMSVLLQRPDTARARPSTLLENDESYEKLFHENNSLKTYFVAASWGRAIENSLKDSKKYETAENNDIKFYILYYYACTKVNSLYPSNKNIDDLENFEIVGVDRDIAIDICYDIYRELGGNDKVAKGTEYLDKVKDRLRTVYGL